MPTVPIDWASVNWLYVAVLAGFVFLDLDWRDFVQARFLQRCGVSPIVCGSLCVLDLLPARLALANIGQCPEAKFAAEHLYPETRQALIRAWRSGGDFDVDAISEIFDAAHEAHGGAGFVATNEVVGAKVGIVGAVSQHMIDRGKD